MRNIPINDVDHLPQAVLALGSDYPADTLLDTHSHRRAQFLYAPEGLMKVETEDGQWLVLPYSGVWIPAGKAHQVWLSKVSTYSLYIEVSNAPRQANYCEVVQVSPLMHQLLIQANQLPVDYQRSGRDGALIDLLLYELEAAPALPLFIPLPHNTLLSKQCAEFMQHPDIHSSPKDWAHDHNKSERTFHRWFKSETGLSFQAWRNRVCIIYALNALKENISITEIAFNLGYEHSAAFTAMFSKIMGYPPTHFQKRFHVHNKSL